VAPPGHGHATSEPSGENGSIPGQQSFIHFYGLMYVIGITAAILIARGGGNVTGYVRVADFRGITGC
jgi:prolipoprotein diacylglyceryltransferase